MPMKNPTRRGRCARAPGTIARITTWLGRVMLLFFLLFASVVTKTDASAGTAEGSPTGAQPDPYNTPPDPPHPILWPGTPVVPAANVGYLPGSGTTSPTGEYQ